MVRGVRMRQQAREVDGRRSSFILRTVKQWKRLPREVVLSPSLKVYKTKLEKALGNLF